MPAIRSSTRARSLASADSISAAGDRERTRSPPPAPPPRNFQLYSFADGFVYSSTARRAYRRSFPVLGGDFVCVEWFLGRENPNPLHQCDIWMVERGRRACYVAYFRENVIAIGNKAAANSVGVEWNGDIVLFKVWNNLPDNRFAQIRTPSEANDATQKLILALNRAVGPASYPTRLM